MPPAAVMEAAAAAATSANSSVWSTRKLKFRTCFPVEVSTQGRSHSEGESNAGVLPPAAAAAAEELSSISSGGGDAGGVIGSEHAGCEAPDCGLF